MDENSGDVSNLMEAFIKTRDYGVQTSKEITENCCSVFNEKLKNQMNILNEQFGDLPDTIKVGLCYASMGTALVAIFLYCKKFIPEKQHEIRKLFIDKITKALKEMEMEETK